MLLYSKWLELPISVRNKIASQFGIQKKGSTEVFNNTIKSDGYAVKDIESALSREALQKFVGSDEKDMDTLWHLMIEKILGVFQTIPVTPAPVVAKPKKGKKKSDAVA